MKLTEEQDKALNAVNKAITNRDPLFRLAGAAGTGKSTVLAEIIKRHPNAAVCAFTGKAADVLRKKGVQEAGTIHSFIYQYDERLDTFKKVDNLPFSAFIVDEASMISTDILRDMSTYGISMICIGDNHQLEPVGDDPKLMEFPDLELKEVHRQALESPILKLATIVRQGGRWSNVKAKGLEVTNRKPTMKDILKHKIVLTGFNKTRISINTQVRKHFKRTKPIVKNERMICLQNDRDLQVFNGMLFRVKNIHLQTDSKTDCSVEFDDGTLRDLTITHFHLNKSKVDWKELKRFKGRSAICDYGYAISTHKSQGSSWDSVMVIEEQCGLWDDRRWLYTAITRAEEKLTLFRS
tara:strand:- start:2176 stop:3231 length:1056 start_codon:yes stop_codon:yes gene_type:complete